MFDPPEPCDAGDGGGRRSNESNPGEAGDISVGVAGPLGGEGKRRVTESTSWDEAAVVGRESRNRNGRGVRRVRRNVRRKCKRGRMLGICLYKV